MNKHGLLSIRRDSHEEIDSEVGASPTRSTTDTDAQSQDDLLTVNSFQRILRKELDERFVLVGELNKKISVLEKIVVRQQELIENLQKRDLECNLIISGVPESSPHESTDDHGTVIKLFREIMTPEEMTNMELSETSRLGQRPSSQNPGLTPRRIKAVLGNKLLRNAILKKAKNLKGNKNFPRVYINPDEPVLTRRENSRLRRRLRELRESHKSTPNLHIYLKRGNIFINSDIVDTFSLSNQMFSDSD